MASIDSPNRVLTTIDDVDGKGTDYNSNGGYYIKLELYLLSQSDNNQYIELDPGYTSITANNTYTPLNAIANATRLSMWTGTGAANVYGNDTEYAFSFVGGAGEMSSLSDPDETSTLTTGAFFNQLSDLSVQPSGLTTSVIDIQTGQMDKDLGVIVPNTPLLVTVLVYIEGWDTEATNSIVGALFTISFGFKFGTLDV